MLILAFKEQYYSTSLRSYHSEFENIFKRNVNLCIKTTTLREGMIDQVEGRNTPNPQL